MTVKESDTMNIIGEQVRSKVLGMGTVIEQDSRYITVSFSSKTNKFLFPEAFEKYLVTENPDLQEAIRKTILEPHAIFKRKLIMQNEEVHHQQEKGVISLNSIERRIEDGFGPDYNVQYLSKQPILTYQQVENQFHIRITGFGRGINRTSSTVVLISSVDKKKSGFVYHDHWTSDGDYIYSGEGKTGNQKMSLGNKAIVDAERDGKAIHLFVKFSPQEYYYQGQFYLVEYTYEDDTDETGNKRKEYKFRLRKLVRED